MRFVSYSMTERRKCLRLSVRPMGKCVVSTVFVKYPELYPSCPPPGVMLSTYRRLSSHKPVYFVTTSIPPGHPPFLSKPPNHGPWRHLLHFPASSVLLLSSRPHVCHHYVFSRDYTLWFAIYRLLVRGFSCVCPLIT